MITSRISDYKFIDVILNLKNIMSRKNFWGTNHGMMEYWNSGMLGISPYSMDSPSQFL
jgi:hypothetical protein